MIFSGTALVAHGVFGPNPITNPGDVKDEQIAQVPKRVPSSDRELVALLLTLDAGAGETATVDVWALDESSTPVDPNLRTPTSQAARKFYRVATGVVLTNHILTAVTIAVGGPLFIALSADTLAAGGTIRAAIV